MNRRFFQFAVVLLWLALPVVALQYQKVWNHLPARLATHFNAANQPNGWMSREESLHVSLWMVAIALLVSSVALVAASWHKVEPFAWALLGFFALLIGFFLNLNQSILNYNVRAEPIHPARMIGVIAIAGAGVVALYLSSGRQVPLPTGETFAVEMQSGRGWSVIIALAFLGPMLALILGLKRGWLPLIPLAFIGVCVFAMAWSGFQYRFMQHGVEIHMLGFRLRSIPRSAIVSYSIEPWAFIRGYGIRGVGSTRAYVWGNKVVHIKTSHGDVYLGHNDPGRIVHDLDRVMGSAAGV